MGTGKNWYNSLELFNAYDSRSHSCRKCNTYYWDLNHLRKHSASCRKPNKLSLCDVCGREFRNNSVLRIHRKEHSEIKKIYECFLCRKTMNSKYSLKHHIQMIHAVAEPKFKCEYCDREFYRKSHYSRHKTMYTDNYSSECSHCIKKFRSEQKLNVCKQTNSFILIYSGFYLVYGENSLVSVFQIHIRIRLISVFSAAIAVRTVEIYANICDRNTVTLMKITPLMMK